MSILCSLFLLHLNKQGGGILSTVVDTVRDLVTPILDSLDLYLVDLEFVKEGKSWYLRVFIDKKGGVDIEECALVSEQLSEKLDNLDPDPIPQAYFLEVSSPGAERPLKKEAEYQNAIGEYIHVSLYKALDGKKVFEGYLDEVTPEQLTMTIKDKTRRKQITLDRKQIAKARLAIEF